MVLLIRERKKNPVNDLVHPWTEDIHRSWETLLVMLWVIMMETSDAKPVSSK